MGNTWPEGGNERADILKGSRGLIPGSIPAHIMQNPDGAAAAQRQQQLQGQAAAIQRDTTESFALLREAVLRLTQHAVRDSPTSVSD
ncbi:unnamed protein product [Boreogadus saida]